MSEVSGPWDGSPGTFGEDQWTALFTRAVASGVFGSSTTPDLLAYGDSSGMHIKLRIGHALLNGQWYNLTAEKTINIRNGDSNDRIDTIVLSRDATANTITAVVHEGTPAAVNPVAATLGPDELPLAHVTVRAARNTSIAPSECLDWRKFAPRYARGGLDGVNLSPSPLESYAPQEGDTLTSEGAHWFWSDDAGAWVKLQTRENTGWVSATFSSPGWSTYTGGGGYPSGLQGRLLNGVVYLRGLVKKNAAGTARTVYTGVIQLPPNMFPPLTHRYTAPASWAGESIDVFISVDGQLNVILGDTSMPAGATFPIDTSFTID